MLPMRTLWNVLKAIALVLVLNACEIGEDEVSYHFVTLQVVDVDMPEAFRLSETYQVEVTVLETNGCTEFEGFNIAQQFMDSAKGLFISPHIKTKTLCFIEEIPDQVRYDSQNNGYIMSLEPMSQSLF